MQISDIADRTEFTRELPEHDVKERLLPLLQGDQSPGPGANTKLILSGKG